MKWTNRPTGRGYCWMRWRMKYHRRWSYEVIWPSAGSYENRGDEISVFMEWKTIADFPHAEFGPPLQEPDDAAHPGCGRKWGQDKK